MPSDKNIEFDDTPEKVPAHPYDRVTMTHTFQKPGIDGKTREVTRPVARYIDEARKNRYDYYHPGASANNPGGIMYNSEGRPDGQRMQAGWLLYGYKWQDDDIALINANLLEVAG